MSFWTRWRSRLWLPALLLGLVLLGTGYALGQGDIVLSKAIRICLECIGIG